MKKLLTWLRFWGYACRKPEEPTFFLRGVGGGPYFEPTVRSQQVACGKLARSVRQAKAAASLAPRPWRFRTFPAPPLCRNGSEACKGRQNFNPQRMGSGDLSAAPNASYWRKRQFSDAPAGLMEGLDRRSSIDCHHVGVAANSVQVAHASRTRDSCALMVSFQNGAPKSLLQF